MLYGLALLAGIVAGSRALTAPAAVSWAAQARPSQSRRLLARLHGLRLDALDLHGSRARRTRHRPASLDAEPKGPHAVRRPASSRGALSGATLGASGGSWIVGLVAGVIGAVIGTYGGAEVRARMAKAFGSDPPAALIEDAGAIILGLVIAAVSR